MGDGYCFYASAYVLTPIRHPALQLRGGRRTPFALPVVLRSGLWRSAGTLEPNTPAKLPQPHVGPGFPLRRKHPRDRVQGMQCSSWARQRLDFGLK